MPRKRYPEHLHKTAFQIPKSDWERLGAIAAARGPLVSIAELVREAIRLYLAVHDGAARAVEPEPEPAEVA